MSESRASILAEYPFVKCDATSLLKETSGVFVIMSCNLEGGETACNLLDFGGSVDVGHAIEASLANNNWRAAYRHTIYAMVAPVSPMECETLLRRLHEVKKNINGEAEGS
jgi:hypothetical protein